MKVKVIVIIIFLIPLFANAQKQTKMFFAIDGFAPAIKIGIEKKFHRFFQ